MPLCDDLVDLLRGKRKDGEEEGDGAWETPPLPRFAASDFIFSSSGEHGVTKFAPLKQRLDKAMAAKLGVEAVEPWVFHDLRRTAGTNFQKLGTRFEVAEAILNHVGASRAEVAGIYLRHDWANEKRAALEAWSAKIREIASGEAAAENVIEFSKAKA